MSNQNATLNRVTLLESIEAARRSIEVCQSFHNLAGPQNTTNRTYIAANLICALSHMRESERCAAILEAWGNGP